MSVIFEQAAATWRQCRDEYELYVEAAMDAAERECRGVLLSERGRRAGVTARSLFSGNEATAYAYASEELVAHWAAHPRVTFADFEAAWMQPQRYVMGLTY